MRRTAGLVALSTIVATPAQAADAIREITAAVETPALFDDEAGGDADADDPAIWINPGDKARSRIIGTAKNGGLRVYDLAGREVQSITPPADGRFNDVDLVTGFRLGGAKADLAVVTDRAARLSARPAGPARRREHSRPGPGEHRLHACRLARARSFFA